MCEHKNFVVDAKVNRLEDFGRFVADIQIRCSECFVPFVFVGLPAGLNLDGAAVSMDGTEGRFGIVPKGEAIPPFKGAPRPIE
jgi:hypothetical protein